MNRITMILLAALAFMSVGCDKLKSRDQLDKTCFIKADARARYEKVEDVIDNLRASGVDSIGLITEVAEKPKKAGT